MPFLRNHLKSVVLMILIIALLAGCAGVGSYSYASSHGKSARVKEYYPGKLRIEKNKHLTKDEQKVEARFARYLEDNTEEALARYRKLFGNESSTDNARELSKDYAPGGPGATNPKTNVARTIWGRAIHEPSTALVKEFFKRELKKPVDPNGLNLVVFTAGGVAAGKSTSLKQFPELIDRANRAQVVVDSTLSSMRGANRLIGETLGAGKKLNIFYVHRDPMESFVNGALKRARENGRTLPLDYFLNTHMGAPKVLINVAKRFRGDPRVEITVIDGNRGIGNAVIADIKFLERVVQKYNREELRKALFRALEDAHKKGKRGKDGGISEIIYRSFNDTLFEKAKDSPGSKQSKNLQQPNRVSMAKRELRLPALSYLP